LVAVLTLRLAGQGGASRSVKVFHLTTIFARKARLLALMNAGNRGKRKIYYRVTMSTGSCHRETRFGIQPLLASFGCSE
jgi:hypothetical protein